ncbi:MAG: hypothetical protein J0H88_18385 [Sphingomonadales bacterium]|nr:hypothetical protein [Sphingomonadales bacterium]
MRPLSSVPATPYVDQLSIGAGRRAFAIGLAVLIPLLLLLMLLTFGPKKPPRFKDVPVTVVSIDAPEAAEEAVEPSPRESKRAETKPLPEPPAPDEPVQPKAADPVAAPAPPAPPPPPLPPTTVPRIGARPPGGQVYGPPDTGGSSSAYRDTERVGTAPNGEPLYAAAWYREPSDDELRGYLSTADGPGWGLIACRTAPDYRVEDCVGLDEYPNGSQIMRAVLAAAWQFRVRPPRLGGKQMVGAWVRIRIDYGIRRR